MADLREKIRNLLWDFQVVSSGSDFNMVTSPTRGEEIVIRYENKLFELIELEAKDWVETAGGACIHTCPICKFVFVKGPGWLPDVTTNTAGSPSSHLDEEEK